MSPQITQIVLVVAATLFCASCFAPPTQTGPVNAPPSSSPRSRTRPQLTAPESTFSGRVLSVADGDTIVILDDAKRSYEIRLQGIDAPEGGQAFGNRSRQNLSELIDGRDVTVEWSKRDRYGRLVGKVLLDGRDVCLEQIRAGMAWHYMYYQAEQSREDRELYANAETEARATTQGIWSDANPIPPWDFRRTN